MTVPTRLRLWWERESRGGGCKLMWKGYEEHMAGLHRGESSLAFPTVDTGTPGATEVRA